MSPQPSRRRGETHDETVASQLTTAHQLGSLIKSARDIMRKDKGLNGDLDRLPMLTWVMFLKFLDDAGKASRGRGGSVRRALQAPIEPPYRWRDWAAKEDGITGPELTRLHQPGRSGSPGWDPWRRPVRLSPESPVSQRQGPARSGRQRVPRRHEPHGVRATCSGT